MQDYIPNEVFLRNRVTRLLELNTIDKSIYTKYDVKRGLRNADGTGVIAGVTNICNVRGYYIQDGERMPMDGSLTYRGIDVQKLVEGFTADNRFGYEETAYLILFGDLPNESQLAAFKNVLHEYKNPPDRFTEDNILSAPSRDIMNKLERSMLALYSYDENPELSDIASELDKMLRIIAMCPTLIAHAYAAKSHYFDNKSLYLHRPNDDLSLAENFLYSIRHDNVFSAQEAHLLDLCMVLHAEHGGGNNSAFTCRCVSSTGSDVYSALAAAIGSLKGPRHGGANKKVMEMFDYIKREVSDWGNDGQVRACLEKIKRGEGGDGSGLIYGIGHAVYTLSDPRAVLLKRMAIKLAEDKGYSDEFKLLESVERLAPDVLSENGIRKTVSANVDFYSGLVYKMLDIPEELFTPLFAMSRIVGWCAHRMEEAFGQNRIVRPAYKVMSVNREYTPLENR
ncbi:MAG: citrate synthase [Oscillospiraceae bacterium]|nr:citrate synthase [Oscillospiraceae bacterium]